MVNLPLPDTPSAAVGGFLRTLCLLFVARTHFRQEILIFRLLESYQTIPNHGNQILLFHFADQTDKGLVQLVIGIDFLELVHGGHALF